MLLISTCVLEGAEGAFGDIVVNHVEDALEEDDQQALGRLNDKLDEIAGKSAKFGILMVTGPQELAWSDPVIRIWRAYCEEHKYGFFVHRERLTTEDLRYEWTKPRALIETLQKVRWKYVMLVDSSSFPVDLKKSLQHVVKQHMYQKRYKQDKPKERLVWCPEDCEEDYQSAYQEGACYGPMISSGCIFKGKKDESVRLARQWYKHRNEKKFTQDQALVQAFNRMRDQNFGAVYFKDVQKEIGRSTSSFIVTFSFDSKYGWNIRDQIHDYISKNKELSRIVNQADDERKAEL